MTTKIGQTSNELTNNVIEKNRITRISSVRKPKNDMPKSDQIIFEYEYSTNGDISNKYIVISFNLFKQKKQDDANLVLEEALFQSLRISPDWERNYILKDITEGLIELDQIDLAIKVSSNIKELEHETFFVELRIFLIFL